MTSITGIARRPIGADQIGGLEATERGHVALAIPSRGVGSTDVRVPDSPNTRMMDRDLRAGSWLIGHRARLLAALAFTAIVVGGGLHIAGAATAGDAVWRVVLAVLAAELAVEVARTVVVERHMGVDTIALVAMVGALALGELPRASSAPAWASRSSTTARSRSCSSPDLKSSVVDGRNTAAHRTRSA